MVHRMSALADALAAIRSMPEAAIEQLTTEAEAGGTEALEWAAARLSDVLAARDALEFILDTGIRAGAYTVQEAADADSHTRKEWADVQAAFDWARDAGVFAEAAKQYERERGRGR